MLEVLCGGMQMNMKLSSLRNFKNKVCSGQNCPLFLFIMGNHCFKRLYAVSDMPIRVIKIDFQRSWYSIDFIMFHLNRFDSFVQSLVFICSYFYFCFPCIFTVKRHTIYNRVIRETYIIREYQK